MSFHPFRLILAALCAAAFLNVASAQTPFVIMLFKLGGAEQTSATGQSPNATGYGAIAIFRAPVPTSTVVRLNGQGISQVIPRQTPDTYFHEAYFNSEAALHSALPDGSYTFAVSGGGVASNTAVVLPPGALPRAPLITNYAALQNWSGGSFTVNWEAFTGGSAEDLVELSIERADGTEIYSSPGFGEPGALDGLDTSVTVPALAAAPGEILHANLMFVKFSYGFANAGETIVANGRGVVSRFTIVRALPARPVIALQPRAQTVAAGGAVAFSAGVSGGNLSYQWRRNGVPITGATAPTYLITNTQPAAAGFYTVDVSNASGSVTSESAQLTVLTGAGAPSRISNLSIRSQAGAGSEPLIIGFVIGGSGTSGPKPLLLRGVGPALVPFGVPNALSDPQIALYQGSTKILENDNWAGDAQVIAITTQLGAFSLGAVTARDAAIYHPAFSSVSYTLQVGGSSGSSGVVLAEIYDTTPGSAFAAATPRLINVSARSGVGTGGDILIGGFIIDGPTAKTVLVRGIGPSLASYGVPGVLADPKLEVYAGSALVQSNDDWAGDATLPPTFMSVGAFPLNPGSRDAALIVTLPAGSYTAQISGVGGTTGNALVEVYEVP